MKKKITGIFLTMALLMAGCSEDQKSYEGTQQVRTGSSPRVEAQEEAVNTIQIKSKYKVTDSMEELKEAVIGILGEDYWPDTLLTAEELAERTGISEDMYDDFLAEYQHANAGIDMMILIETEEEKTGTIEKLLNEYRDSLLQVYEDQPQNKAKVFASRIEVINDHVCYIQLGADLKGLEESGEDIMVSHCQEENERALDIIEKRILQS